MSRERASRRFYRVDSCSNLSGCLDRGMRAEDENRWSFEVAWEAANKGLSITFVLLCSKIIYSTVLKFIKLLSLIFFSLLTYQLLFKDTMSLVIFLLFVYLNYYRFSMKRKLQ